MRALKAKSKPKLGKARPSLVITHPNAAGIDIGSASHFVAVPPDRDDEPVREFSSFTGGLQALADWLAACKVDVVAMESTGVYWIPLFELLESRGFKVLLVNARHVKNVSGRKSDVLDCQWLQQLMTYGLLSGAFRPGEQVCVLRALGRQRETLLRTQARTVNQHMQKALTQMNLQLTNVISDVAGETGLRILRAIDAGERDGHVLAAMRNSRIRASQEEIAQSLQGTWRTEHLFALHQALAAYDFTTAQLAEVDREIEKQLETLGAHEGEPGVRRKRGRARNAPRFDLRTHLFRMCGVDLTQDRWNRCHPPRWWCSVKSDRTCPASRPCGTSPVGWAYAREPGSPAARFLPARPNGVANRAAPGPCAWPRPPCEPANLRSAPISAGSALGWTSPRPSRPQPTSWPG